MIGQLTVFELNAKSCIFEKATKKKFECQANQLFIDRIEYISLQWYLKTMTRCEHKFQCISCGHQDIFDYKGKPRLHLQPQRPKIGLGSATDQSCIYTSNRELTQFSTFYKTDF